MVIIVTLLSPWLVEMLTVNEYYTAWPIVGILSWQSLFYGFFLIASAGIWKAEKTSLNFYIMIGATCFGLLMNWLLVPKYAEVGAAIATAITYLFWVVISMIVSEFFWKTAFSWIIFVIQVFSGAIFVGWYINEGFTYKVYNVLMLAFLAIFIQILTALDRTRLMLLIRSMKAN